MLNILFGLLFLVGCQNKPIAKLRIDSVPLVNNEAPYAITEKGTIYSIEKDENGIFKLYGFGFGKTKNLLKAFKGPKSASNQLVIVGESALHVAGCDDNPNEQCLWIAEGAQLASISLGTQMPSAGIVGPELFAAKSRAYIFTNPSERAGKPLWVSDGTAKGTVQITNYTQKPPFLIGPIVTIGNAIFFAEQTGWADGDPKMGLRFLDDTDNASNILLKNILIEYGDLVKLGDGVIANYYEPNDDGKHRSCYTKKGTLIGKQLTTLNDKIALGTLNGKEYFHAGKSIYEFDPTTCKLTEISITHDSKLGNNFYLEDITYLGSTSEAAILYGPSLLKIAALTPTALSQLYEKKKSDSIETVATAFFKADTAGGFYLLDQNQDILSLIYFDSPSNLNKNSAYRQVMNKQEKIYMSSFSEITGTDWFFIGPYLVGAMAVGEKSVGELLFFHKNTPTEAKRLSDISPGNYCYRPENFQVIGDSAYVKCWDKHRKNANLMRVQYIDK